jgi:hypothetical protein
MARKTLSDIGATLRPRAQRYTLYAATSWHDYDSCGCGVCDTRDALKAEQCGSRSSDSSVPAARAASRNFWICDFRFEVVMAVEYIIYCDESESKGRHFSNFYGGALVTSNDLEFVRDTLAKRKKELNLFGEIKWSKITPNYRKKYIDMVDCFFDLIQDGKVKVRVMFTQNVMRARNLTKEHVKNQYAILYYYFIRHAFGLVHSPGPARVRVYPDQMPLSAAQFASFRAYVVRLGGRSEFRAKRITFAAEDIAEVVSHNHDILQCLDVVLGAMNFRLNDKHEDKPLGAKRRSAKTMAKLKVYKHINKRIRDLYPHFNIGITTGHQGDRANRWHHRYRHWRFMAKDHEMLPGSKRKRQEAP